MKRSTLIQIIFTALIFFQPISSLTGQISGKVKYQDNTPAAFSNVILYQQADSSMVSGTVTDINGIFKMEKIVPDEYYLLVNAIGYQEKIISDIHYKENRNIIIPDIILNEQAIELEGVEVTAAKLQVSHNKEGMVLNVQSSLLTKGSTILQLLERSPGVMIDRRNGDLVLNGQTGTLIMINGKAQRIPVADLIQMLNGMDGSNVEKIELINNPSSKYDAEGGGIINIQLGKSEIEGTNGSLSLNLGRGWGNKTGGSISVNNFSGKTNIYGNYSINQDNSFSNWRAIGSSVVPVLGGFNQFDFSSNNGVNTTSHNSQFGFEREFSSSLTLGTSVTYNFSNAKEETNNLGITTFDADSILISKIHRRGIKKWNNGAANIFLRKKLKKNASIGFDLDYLLFDVENPNEINNIFQDEFENEILSDNIYYAQENRGNSKTKIDVGVLKLDYQKTLENGLRIEAGVKTSYSHTLNSASIYRLSAGEWIVDERSQTEQTIKENIGAGYLSMDYQVREKTNIGLGVRYERWKRDFTNDELDRTFDRFFPTLFITQEIGEYNTFQAAYNRRIARPTYNDLASYLSYNGPISVFTGNPNLLATITDNIKFTFQRGGKSIGLFYRKESNPIARYQISRNDDANLAVISPQNVAYQNSYGIESYIPVEITKRWSFNIGGSLARRYFKVTHTEVDKKGAYTAFNFNGSTNLNLPKDFSIELSGWYVSNHFNGSGKVNGYGLVNAGLKKDFGLKYGSLQFSVNDIFKSFKINSAIGALTEEAFDSKAKVWYKAESGNNRIFRLTYSYTFGSQKIKKQQVNKNTNEEEERIIK